MTTTTPQVSADYSQPAPVAVQHTMALLGRVLMCIIFVLSGLGKAMNSSMYIAYMHSKHLPIPQVGIWVAVVVELGGGLLLLFGLKARWAATIMALFLIPTTLIFHNFWSATGSDHVDQLVHFQKNLAIIGGLLMVAAAGPGRFSADGR